MVRPIENARTFFMGCFYLFFLEFLTNIVNMSEKKTVILSDFEAVLTVILSDFDGHFVRFRFVSVFCLAVFFVANEVL